jgi:PKD repeat protein
MISKKFLFIISLIFISLIIGSVSAAQLSAKAITEINNMSLKDKINLKDNIITETQITKVLINDNGVELTNKLDNSIIKSEIYINNNKFDYKSFTSKNKELILNDVSLSNIELSYQYNETSLKEKIVLQEDKDLKFNIKLQEGYKLVPWYNNQWKIISSTSDNTMIGTIIEEPYGIDADGHRIRMNYTYNNNKLNLNYDRYYYLYNNNKSELKYITYPLTIDPTYTAVGDRYESNESFTYYVKWNTTGSTSWKVPKSSTNFTYLIVAGGGAGGSGYEWENGGAGGGAGGILNGTMSLEYNSTVSITVGAGGTIQSYTQGLNGDNSSFVEGSNVSKISIGGGGGGGYANQNGKNGGSGGGGAGGPVQGSSLGGQGNNGGPGDYGGGGSGGGGGVGSVGGAPSIYPVHGGNGGSGKYYYIDNPSGTALGGGGGGGVDSIDGDPGGDGTYGGGDGGMEYGNGYTGTANTGGGGGGAGGSAYSAVSFYGGNGGSGIIIIKYQIIPVITQFTANKTTINTMQPVQFTDTSLNNPTSWQWTFGDGNTSSSQNPLYFYNKSGDYTVSLTASNIANANTTTKTNYINVTNSTPFAQFTSNVTSGMTPLIVQFTDQTNSSTTSWNWTFGSSNFSNLQNPSYTFTGAGLYNVKLNASNFNGYNITIKTNYINVTIAPAYPLSFLNLTPSLVTIPFLRNKTIIMSGKNVSGYSIYADIKFNKSSINVQSTSTNYSIYPGLVVNSIIDNDNGHVYLNITNNTGDSIYLSNIETPLADINFKTIGYTNSTEPLSFNDANVLLSTGYKEKIKTQIGNLLLLTNGIFNFYIKIIDSSSSNTITKLVHLNATGSNVSPTSSSTESGTSSLFTSNYGIVNFSISSDGYYTYTNDIFIDNDNTYVIKLTPYSGSSQTTWYSPHQVRITLIDQFNGDKLVGATVNVTALTNTFPVGSQSDYLISVYGINAQSANDMMNGTLIMSGTSDNDGSSVFTMLSSIGYNVHIVNTTLGIDHNVKIYPLENDYNIWVTTSTQSTPLYNSIANTSLTYTAPNATYGTFGLTYQDISGSTSQVIFNVTCIDNRTVMYSNTLSGFGSGIASDSYTIKVVRGEQYRWEYNATRV